MNKEELQKSIENDKQERSTKFRAAINAAIEEFNCEILPVMIMRNNKIETTIEIIVKEL